MVIIRDGYPAKWRSGRSLRNDAAADRVVSGEATVDLTEIERAFLKQLISEPWISTALFDHELVARLIELGLVEANPLASGEVEYSITAVGRAALS